MKYYYLEKKNCNPPNHTFACILSLAAYYLTVQVGTLDIRAKLQTTTVSHISPIPFFNAWIYIGIIVEVCLVCSTLFTVNECEKRRIPLILKYRTLPMTIKEYYQVKSLLLVRYVGLYFGIAVILYLSCYVTIKLPKYLVIKAIPQILFGVLYAALITISFLVFNVCRDAIWIRREHA